MCWQVVLNGFLLRRKPNVWTFLWDSAVKILSFPFRLIIRLFYASVSPPACLPARPSVHHSSYVFILRPAVRLVRMRPLNDMHGGRLSVSRLLHIQGVSPLRPDTPSSPSPPSSAAATFALITHVTCSTASTCATWIHLLLKRVGRLSKHPKAVKTLRRVAASS